MSTTLSSINGNSPKHRRKVSFTNLEIRTYANTLGDHPDCKFGPPISIDWEHIKADKIPLEEYEAERSPRRSRRQLQLPSYVRKRLLREQWGIPAEDLVEAAKEARRIQKLRQQSNLLAFLGPFEEWLEILTGHSRNLTSQMIILWNIAMSAFNFVLNMNLKKTEP